MIIGGVVCVGGQAMLTQLRPDTSTLYWAASLVVTGLGSGMAMQLPYTVVSVALEDGDIPTGNAIMVFFQQLGGISCISMGQTIILSTLLDLVPKTLPHVPVESVIKAGGTDLTSLGLADEDLAILRHIWNTAITRTMILATAALGASVLFTLAVERLNVNTVAKERKEAPTGEQQEYERQDKGETRTEA